MKRMLLAILLVLVAGCRQTLRHGLDETQANEIETVLLGSGIAASKSREGGREARFSIEVPEQSSAAALKLLNDYGLPREPTPGFAEVFGKGSMVPTAIEENALFLHALSGEVGKTLTSVHGVVAARVHLVSAPVGPPSTLRAPVKPRASVLLKVRHGEVDAVLGRKGEIQALVAGSIEGLDEGSVCVMLSELPAPPPSPPSVTAPPSAKVPLAIAATLVAVLSGALAFALLRIRRLRRSASGVEGSATAIAVAPAR